MLRWRQACGALLLAMAVSAHAEERRETETVVVVAGPRYGASWPFRIFFGGQWRDHWTTPIRVRKLVFLEHESSSTWHPAAGAGLWLALHAGGETFQLVSPMSVAVVRSDEGTTFYLSSTFEF